MYNDDKKYMYNNLNWFGDDCFNEDFDCKIDYFEKDDCCEDKCEDKCEEKCDDGIIAYVDGCIYIPVKCPCPCHGKKCIKKQFKGHIKIQ